MIGSNTLGDSDGTDVINTVQVYVNGILLDSSDYNSTGT